MYLDLKSHHFKPKPYYFENHDLLGFEHNRYLIVYYSNSEGNTSFILGRRATWGNIGRVSYGAKYGIVTGYNTKYLGHFAPFAMLNAVVNFGHINLDINLIPAVVVTVGARVDF